MTIKDCITSAVAALDDGTRVTDPGWAPAWDGGRSDRAALQPAPLARSIRNMATMTNGDENSTVLTATAAQPIVT